VGAKGQGGLVNTRLPWKACIGFIAGAVLCALTVQTALVYGLKHNRDGNVGIMNRVMRGEINANIVVSGSSRAMYHYDPRIIEAETHLSAFNLGRNGTKLHEQIQLLKIYLRRNRRPDYLVHNVDIAGLLENDDVTDAKQYVAWLDDQDVFGPLRDQKRYFELYRWCPLLGIARTGGMQAAVLGLFDRAGAQADDLKGYSPQDRVWNEDFEKFRAQNPSGVRWTTDRHKVQSLVQLLKLCLERGIQPILVLSPDYHETRGLFLNRGEALQVFQEIAAELDVPFWDYSEDPIASDRTLFYNSQHLNQRGATAFSESIAVRLKNRILGERDLNMRVAMTAAAQKRPVLASIAR
jgi:hypothetical protein